MAVRLGYKNVYRDPYGFPEWQGRDLPVASAPAGLAQTTEESKAPGPLYGWAMIWTLLGYFYRGNGLKPDSVCISNDTDHCFLFRWSGR